MTQAEQTTCPHCGQTYSMEPWQFGQRFPCSRCNQEFIAGAPVYRGSVLKGPRQTKSNGMAIASFVCGLFVCMPLASLLAVIFGIIALRKCNDKEVGGKGMGIAGVILGAAGLLLLPVTIMNVYMPAVNAARDAANRVQSAGNMQQISRAMLDYTNNNNGNYPPDLGTLFKTENLDVHVFVCPGTGTTPPVNMTIDQAVQWINLNSDYIYMGSGMKTPLSANTLVIYEKDSNHANRGDNVLYGDGRILFMPIAAVHETIAAANYYGNTH